jgi:hypothetical protein
MFTILGPRWLWMTRGAPLHTQCDAVPWWKVDLASYADETLVAVANGDDAQFAVTSVTIGNRVDCCGRRLQQFYIEVLDADHTVVDSIYYGPAMNNGDRRTFNFDAPTVGRYVEIRFERAECLQLGMVQVNGYAYEAGSPGPRVG